MRRAALVVLAAATAWVAWGRLTRWRHARQLRPSPDPWPPLDAADRS